MPGLEDLYREIILDHYRSPRNRGELETPPAVRADGFNPLCGDEIIVYIDVADDGTISDVAIGGQGCSISQSSASMMSAAIKGKSVADARHLISAFKGLMSIHESDIGGDGSESEMGIDDRSFEGDAFSIDNTDDVSLGDLEALKGVVKFPVRIKCATLSWNTLAQALDEVQPG
ncbi:MAG: iron-sulfur cluster assembly scaffold protein NifU [Acidimicrobiales bacterium]|nr:MAG: iron-sulfur cluster assembly scaffold protein NifU [Acidimicrobiales bacterium]